MTERLFLKGSGVSLRVLAEGDLAGPYLDWLNDPDVCKWNGHHRFPYSQAEASAWLKRMREQSSDLTLAILTAEDSRHVGNVALQAIDLVNRSAEFAILLGDRSCWGKGVGTEAATLILRHGFSSLNLHRVYCGTIDGNHAMVALARRLGMVEEGRRRQAVFKDGEYRDIVEFGVLRSEFPGAM